MVRETNPVLVIWELKCTVVRMVEGHRTGSAGNLSWGSFPRLVPQLPLLSGGVGNQPLSGSLQLHRRGVNVGFYAAFLQESFLFFLNSPTPVKLVTRCHFRSFNNHPFLS